MDSKKSLSLGGVEFNLHVAFLIVFTTLVAIIDYYDHVITGIKAYDRFILYFLLPLAVILIFFRHSPGKYGFRIGNWRFGLLVTLLACVVMAFVLWFVAQIPSMQEYYSLRAPDRLLILLGRTGLEYFAWEFIWRGFLLFGLSYHLGPGPAILLQAVPFAFMHLGKPELETLTTIFGGSAFGYLSWRSRSFLYPFLIHWFMIVFTVLIASGRFG